MLQDILHDVGAAIYVVAVAACVIVAVLAVAFLGGVWWLLDLIGAFSTGGF